MIYKKICPGVTFPIIGEPAQISLKNKYLKNGKEF
jgi:hypothetical protein